MTPRWLIIGVPGERRLTGFLAALAQAGAVAAVVPWPAVVADPACVAAAARPGDILRIESPGDDAATWHALARLGGASAGLALPFGRWRPGRWWAAGLAQVLTAMKQTLADVPLTWGNAPDDLLLTTDKRACSHLLAQHGVAVPPALTTVPEDPATLRAVLVERGWTRVFVKPRWGSSGAGVMAWARNGRDPAAAEVLTTTLVVEADDTLGLRKRLSRYTDRATIDRLLAAVLADGAVVERWLPKVGTADGPLDLRVLAIAGEPRHAVARVGRGPLTNLHLDARRLDYAELLTDGPTGLEHDIAALVRAAAAAFPASTHIGFDVLLDHDWRPWVIEANGWGDHLPRLLHRGEDAYAAEIAVLARRAGQCPALAEAAR